MTATKRHERGLSVAMNEMTNSIKLLDYWLEENHYYRCNNYSVSSVCILLHGIANIYDDRNGEITIYKANACGLGLSRPPARTLEMNMNDPEFFEKLGHYLNLCSGSLR